MILFIKLLLTHFIGDFILQPDSWVKEKEEKKLGSLKLYVHVLLHGTLVYLILWNENPLFPTLIIVTTHFIIDALKLYCQKEENKREWFFIDQVLHIAVLVAVSCYRQNPSFSFESFFTEEKLIYITAVIALTLPASLLIKNIISKFEIRGNSNESLESAGKYIGIIERLLVLTFILMGHWESIGYLIAAKSIFRFGDLTAAKERKLTEYILIGTLLSFGIALLVGISAKYLLGIITV